MPIYEYQCDACGKRSELLEKISAPPATECPECGKSGLRRLVSAAAFQLKGSGWYVTDFKNGSKPASDKKSSGEKPENKQASGADKKSGGTAGGNE